VRRYRLRLAAASPARPRFARAFHATGSAGIAVPGCCLLAKRHSRSAARATPPRC